MVPGRQMAVENVLRRRESVTPEAVQELAAHLFTTLPALAAVGPVASKEEFASWLRQSFAKG